ncbi:MAG: hypothetical protein R3B46_02215 [Phycisphaerales bacterium]
MEIGSRHAIRLKGFHNRARPHRVRTTFLGWHIPAYGSGLLGEWADVGLLKETKVMSRKSMSISKLATTSALVVLAGVGGVMGYRFMRAEISATVYRQRLEDLSLEYASLRDRYNDAVRKTVVTELIVRDQKLSVRVRDASGVLKEIATPYDPSREIYVDYVVVDSRLWIRRVFDAQTPPSQALVIDPVYDDVDWDCAGAEHGKAVYRALGEGRWVVTASGNGSLGLVRADDTEAGEIAPPVTLKDFEAEIKQADASVDSIGLGDVWRALVGK